MISKTADSTNFSSGRPLELSMRGRKPVESCQVSMATDLQKGVLSQILLKNHKMTESSIAYQSFKITAKAFETFRNDLSFHVLFEKVIYI